MIDVRLFGSMTKKQKAKYLKTLSDTECIMLYYAIKEKLSLQFGTMFADARCIDYGHPFAECKGARMRKRVRNTASSEHAGKLGYCIKEKRFSSAVVAYRGRYIY